MEREMGGCKRGKECPSPFPPFSPPRARPPSDPTPAPLPPQHTPPLMPSPALLRRAGACAPSAARAPSTSRRVVRTASTAPAAGEDLGFKTMRAGIKV